MLAALNPNAVQFGPFRIRWYGIIIASAVLLAVFLSVREGRRRGIAEDDIYDCLLWALPVALVCARAYYVIFQWKYYSQNPAMIPCIWDGGIAIYGGLIGALITLVVLCHRRHINFWLLLDVVAPTVILAQGIGRWGNFMNQEAHGYATTLAFLQNTLHLPHFIVSQMCIHEVYYQPTFLYESVWDVLGFIVLISLRHRKHLFKCGEVVLSYVMWYSFGRFFIEGMRTDSLMLGPIRVSQWLSVLLFVGALALIVYRRWRNPDNPWYLDQGEQRAS